jgi:hypothetical protein
MSRWPRPLWALVGWSWFLWISRLRNVLNDDDLDSWGVGWRVGVVILFTVLALIAFLGERQDGAWKGQGLNALVWWTIGFWLIRGGGIILDDHNAAFTAVHTVLMVISIGLAMWVRTARPR